MSSDSPPDPTDPDAQATADGARSSLAGLDPVEGTPVDLGRWRLLERIGAGGMGVVYRATDVERGSTVAVKALHRTDPGGLLRLKAEFRSVADVAHENLVMLHELVVEDDRWFFVMEYVEGVGFLEHVRGGAQLVDAAAVEHARQAETLIGTSALAEWVPALGRQLDDDGIRRLRDALRQLASGVTALHAAGKLHRDLKPSNVRVSSTGRVVILDFGLVADDSVAGRDLHGPSAGTPAYMAPEQALGRPATAASDWYALGVMMFEALTGHLPFRGAAREVLESKVHHEVFPPSSIAPAIPADLDLLCSELLRMDPAARPSADDVLRRLASDAAPRRSDDRAAPPRQVTGDRWQAEAAGVTAVDGSADVSGERPLRRRTPPSQGDADGRRAAPPPRVIGRDAELHVLQSALRQAASGEAVAVLVDGPSGVGKTALVRMFADAVRRADGALVLEGRCYERESVPYKAFDALVDALEHELGELPHSRLTALLPPGVNELARIFPVLREVAAVATEGATTGRGPDPQELQARAFRCLKLLLARIAGTRPLVLVIDDLQWGDGDSGRLLSELLAPPERPSILLVCTYRSDEAETPLLRSIARGELLEGVRTLHVPPLGAADAAELARSLLAGNDAVGAASAIAEEAEGSPFFVEQLVRYAEAGGSATVSLGGLLVARHAQLPPDARRLLEVVAVAGRPIEQGVAAAAAGLVDARPALATLRSGSLVRTRGVRERDTVEAYHDRVREGVSALLAPVERAAIHLALAGALASTGRVDPRDLALHLHAAGDRAGAFRHAVRAADDAAAGLAFDRAAELYRLALACDEGTPLERAALQEGGADALVHAGRCAEAAPLYLAASAARQGGAAWELRRRAAEQVLVSGDIDAGVRVLRPVLADVGLPFPRSPATALAAAVARIVQIEGQRLVRGNGRGARVAGEVSPLDVQRFDVCWSAGKGLLSVDPARAAYFFVRSLLIAQGAGEPHRLARSLAIYGMMQVFEGDQRGHDRGLRRLDEAEALAAPLDDAYLRALVQATRGTASMSVGRWHEGLALLEAGIRVFEEQCTGVAWEIGTARSSCFNTRLWLGHVKEIADTAPAWHRASERVGNVFAEVTSDLYTAYAELASGHADAARRRVQRAIGRWTRAGYHFQHWLADKVEVWCDLYEGRGEAAWTRLEALWPALEDSKLLRVQLMAIDCHLLRGLTAAGTSAHDPRRLAVASRDAAALAAIGRPTAAAAAQLLRGQIALARGRVDEARALLDAAASSFEAADVRLHAECARRRLGELRGGEMGQVVIGRADRWMQGQGISDPARFASILAPLGA